MELLLGKQVLSMDRSRVMGILNITPDSFSDGGEFLSPDKAIAQAEVMLADGADIIDVGGESTRPGADSISLQEELDRIIPVIEQINSQLDVAISVDTSKPDVMRAAVAAGAVLINDVFALRQDGAMDAAAELGVVVCLMHMQGEPRSMQVAPEYQELPRDIIDFLAGRIDACAAAGIDRNRIIVDPGFGFGKNDEHNLQILANLHQLKELRQPLLVGLSRKRMLGNLTGKAADQRVFAGIAAAVMAVAGGANIIRTHDVAATVDALKIADAVRMSEWKPGRDNE
ncbi:MAG: dihydropteroate synthase [Gammaproteobacteria bacterium]|nr:MAG: dihydropteroate synthase [Gammaproteobacteria bacterium]RLA32814.1 MAG: dihydropteroate synthase [Gammaproteobacteria bacterium]